MAYDVSKKINVGHGKIMAALINTLFLRKTDAEKTYLPLTGGNITGDVTLKDSSGKELKGKIYDTDSNKIYGVFKEADAEATAPYTKKIELPKTKNTGNKLPNLNVNEWKEFKIKELFKIERGTITSLNKIDDGEVPIVSATDKNQGIAFYGNVEAKYNNCLTASILCAKPFYSVRVYHIVLLHQTLVSQL